MSYVVFGRAIRNEYLSLGTILTTAAIAYAATRGGKKDDHLKAGGPIQETIKKAKEAVPLNAQSSEEEQFIKKFIEEEEAKAKH